MYSPCLLLLSHIRAARGTGSETYWSEIFPVGTPAPTSGLVWKLTTADGPDVDIATPFEAAETPLIRAVAVTEPVPVTCIPATVLPKALLLNRFIVAPAVLAVTLKPALLLPSAI